MAAIEARRRADLPPDYTEPRHQPPDGEAQTLAGAVALVQAHLGGVMLENWVPTKDGREHDTVNNLRRGTRT